ncbi:MAG: tail fiber domain-containing protein, partial [Saprospiraceae bacterium]
MKKTYTILIFISVILMSFVNNVRGQNNVGIGTPTPDYRLHVVNTNPSLLKLENSTILGTDIKDELYFKTGGYYTGSIKTIGTGTVYARMGLFTYASGAASGLLERVSILDNGFVGIGTPSPSFILDVNGQMRLKYNGTPAGLWFSNSTNNNEPACVGMYNDTHVGFYGDNGAGWKFVMNTTSGNVGIGTTTPAFLLDVNGRMRLKTNGGTAGLWLANATNTDDVALLGMYNDNYVGLYGDLGAGWNLVMNTINGRVGIGTVNPTDPLHVVGSFTGVAGRFENNYVNPSAIGVYGTATVSTSGIGVSGVGHSKGVQGYADASGSGYRYGLYSWGQSNVSESYGAHCEGSGGTSAFGIYAIASGATVNYAGYFVGDVYTTGAYLPSDRKLKNNIHPIDNALEIVGHLNPSSYTYKKDEYSQMHLPEGIQYGLIADEVSAVVPGLVKNSVHPAEYENHDDMNGRKLSDEVDFNAVNYTALVPFLIKGMQEQQV